MSNLAYKCYCTSEELEAEREAQRARGEMPHYSGKCILTTPEEQAEKEAQGLEPVIRFAFLSHELLRLTMIMSARTS